MKNVIARHGDMIIFKINEEDIPFLKKTEIKKLTIGLGEVTGHSHEIIALDDSIIIEHHDLVGYDSKETRELADRNNIYFQIKGSAIIMHEEHNPITLNEGFYLRTTQRQFNPFNQTIEKVLD